MGDIRLPFGPAEVDRLTIYQGRKINKNRLITFDLHADFSEFGEKSGYLVAVFTNLIPDLRGQGFDL